MADAVMMILDEGTGIYKGSLYRLVPDEGAQVYSKGSWWNIPYSSRSRKGCTQEKLWRTRRGMECEGTWGRVRDDRVNMNGVSIVFHLKLGKTYSHAPPSLPAHSLLTTIHNLHIYYINAANLQSSQAQPSKISSESTNPTSINQVEPLLIRQYDSSNGFQAWHVQYTHSTYCIFLLKIISKGPVHRQLNSIVDKAQIKSAQRLTQTIIPDWRKYQFLDSLAIPSVQHSPISHKSSQASCCQAMALRLSS